MRARFTAPGLVAALVALALALPAVALAAEVTLTVNKAGTGTGTVECDAGEGLEPCKHSYPKETELVLFAEPEFGSKFVKWTGACSGVFEECELTMSGAKTVTATFDLVEYLLTVSKNGTGTGTVKCNAGKGPETCKAKYPEGTELSLLAGADPGSEFAGWSGVCSGEGNECTFTVEEDTSITATFDLEPALTVNKAGTGTGTVECEAEVGPEACQHSYPKGTELTLLATPDPGSTFAGFSAGSGSASGCSTSCSFTIAANSSVTATFTPIAPTKFKLTVSKSGTGTGTVKGGSPAEPSTINCGSGAGCEHEYLSGAVVTLTHEATAGSEFKEWTGACTGSGTCEVTMSAAKSVGAVFNTQSGGGSGSGGSGGGSTAGAGGTPPPSPPAAGTASAAGTATVTSGKAAIKLTCAGGPCSGSFTLTAKVKQGQKKKTLTIGRASFSLATGASSTLSVKLSGPAKQELAKGKTVKAKAGGAGVAPSTVQLKPAGGTQKGR